MPGFAPEQWQALSPYLDKALEIPPDQRAAWLEIVRSENPSLATDLQALLSEHDALGNEGFLKTSFAGVRADAPTLAGQTVGAYTLESAIGQGGMGTVWLARRSDGRFEGRAAVKFLNIGLFGGATEQRFKREGSILARLSHPNIAHLIDAGVSSTGQPYLILEYVEGKSIDAYCSERALEIEARIRLFLGVLAAVAHAHANLIVHRDIKPSNVLVTGDGQVKLLDFGIAKLLEDETSTSQATVLTRQGDRALTLAYAAPEQVTGNAVTTGTDVYALGVLLYQLLTGKHPAQSALSSPVDLMKAIVDTQPARPSDASETSDKWKRGLRGDLDNIVAKAMKKNPPERYVSVTAFADDLRRYLRHQTISARPDTFTYRAKKFLRRNYLPVGLTAAAFIAIAAGIITIAIQARTVRSERDFALRQLSRAEAINQLNSFVLSDAAPSGKPFTVNDLLARAERLVESQRSLDDENRVELLISLGRQYTVQDEYAKARRLLEKAHTLAQTLPQPSTRARASCALAQSLTRETDMEGAQKLIDEALKLLPDERRFALDRVFCLHRASDVARNRGNSREALARAHQARLALSQLPFRSEVLELDNLITLAGAHRQLGQVREATASFEEAATRISEIGRDNTQMASTLFNNWGVALWQWGRPLEAKRFLGRAIAISEDDRALAAVSPMLLVNYARTLSELGSLDEAADYAERAYSKAKASGDETVVNQSLLVQSGIFCKQGQLARADQVLSEAEPTMRRHLPAGHVGFASLAYQRALGAQAQGAMETAVRLANEAVATAEASIKQGRLGAAYLEKFLVGRSAIRLQVGQTDEAADDARRALKMLLETAQPGIFSSTIGRAHLALGNALRAQAKKEEARSEFQSAVEHLQSALGVDHAETQAARKLAEQ